MTGRIFEDSAGRVWEVFEVRRSSHHSVGVSPGFEEGWLAFVGRDARRRLAPFPREWKSLPPAALERLCARARDVTVTLPPLRGASAPAAPGSPTAPGSPSPSTDDIEHAVRLFTREARARGLQAVAAMMALKAMLREQYPGSASASDPHRVRRWFVETYYFERRGSP